MKEEISTRTIKTTITMIITIEAKGLIIVTEKACFLWNLIIFKEFNFEDFFEEVLEKF